MIYNNFSNFLHKILRTLKFSETYLSKYGTEYLIPLLRLKQYYWKINVGKRISYSTNYNIMFKGI